MHIHFIAIGGAVMHNLAIALHKKGYKVTGSDDEIFDPSKSRLEKYGLLPKEWGWFPGKINKETVAVIAGMHARKDNPELAKATELGVKLYSFPEYLYEQTREKKRVVIAGSHGKTTITSMVMHALRSMGIDFDYMVGSQLEGFETMVGLTKDSRIAIFEGDEYLSSPLDLRPKFIHYAPHITLISGIAWDHMNVYPEYQGYKEQFKTLCKITDKKGLIFYFDGDEELKEIIKDPERKTPALPYSAISYQTGDEGTLLNYKGKIYSVKLIGKYNIENLTGAMKVCKELGIKEQDFLHSMQSFRGAAKRQELLYEDTDRKVYLDFAHAPSKVKATVSGFRESFSDCKLIVFLELHTFSSLNQEFLPQYKNTLKGADEAFVYFNPAVVKHKKMPELSKEFVQECFGKPTPFILRDSGKLRDHLEQKAQCNNAIILIMSSGNMGNINIREIFSYPTDSIMDRE